MAEVRVRKYQRRLLRPRPRPAACRNGHPYSEGSFYRRPNGARACKACLKARGPRDRRASQIRSYGITVEQHDTMLAAQGSVCAICRKPETARHRSGTLKSLAIDHDHETGRVRGLICHNCNLAVSYFENRPGYVDAILVYLEASDG